MKIVSGIAKGQKLKVAAGNEVTRPTSVRVREAVASILRDKAKNANVLDLFAGSGAYGLELLSVGAAECLFVENNSEARDALNANISEFMRRVTKQELQEPNVRVLKTTISESFNLNNDKKFDIIILDPPYEKSNEFAKILFPILLLNIRDDGILIFETSIKTEFKIAEHKGWECETIKKYSKSFIHLITKKSED